MLIRSAPSSTEEEFLHSALRLKGNARAIDSIMIMHEQHLSLKNVINVYRSILQPLYGPQSWRGIAV